MDTGEIYQIAHLGVDDSLPHPHLVVFAFGKDQCLVVQGYTTGKHKITEYVASLPKMGFLPGQGYVELDNAKHVSWEKGFTGNNCTWTVAKFFPLAKKKMIGAALMGRMSPAGLLAIVDGLLIVADAKPERFSEMLLKRLRKLKEALTPPAPPLSPFKPTAQ